MKPKKASKYIGWIHDHLFAWDPQHEVEIWSRGARHYGEDALMAKSVKMSRAWANSVRDRVNLSVGRPN